MHIFSNTTTDTVPLIFQESKKRSLSLSNVAGAYFILIAGLVLSIVVGVIEFVYTKNKPERSLPEVRLISLNKRVYQVNIFLISRKHTFWVLIRSASVRHIFSYRNRKILTFTLQNNALAGVVHLIHVYLIIKILQHTKRESILILFSMNSYSLKAGQTVRVFCKSAVVYYFYHCMCLHVCPGELLFWIAVWPNLGKKLSFWLFACSLLTVAALL